MNLERKVIWQHITPRYNRSFLQPLAVALVCAIFIGLILTMGLIDLRRSERTLNGFMEDQGMRIVGVVERLADENMKTMIQASQKAGGSFIRPPDRASHLAADFPHRQDRCHGPGDRQPVEKRAPERGLYPPVRSGEQSLAPGGPQCLGPGHFHEQEPIRTRHLSGPGERVGMKGQRPGERQPSCSPVSTASTEAKRSVFIALSRKDGSGTIVIGLDQDSLPVTGGRGSPWKRPLKNLGRGRARGSFTLPSGIRRECPWGMRAELPGGVGKSQPADQRHVSDGLPKFAKPKDGL